MQIEASFCAALRIAREPKSIALAIRRTIIFKSHLPEPTVDQRGFPDTGPSNDGNDIYMRICPRVIQEGNILLSTKNIASGNG
jgi:hypothetical protein